MNRRQIINSALGPYPELPSGITEADELAWVLARVLDWPLPQGRVCDYALPGWLSRQAQAALQRYLSQE